MLDELREEEIVNKVGGRFKLSTLIQKRLVALNGGSRALVDIKTDDKMEIVVQEILQDKIFLDAASNVRIAEEQEPVEHRPNQVEITERPEHRYFAEPEVNDQEILAYALQHTGQRQQSNAI